MKYLIKLKGWIGADAIQESDVGARDAGEQWARKQASLMPGEIEVYRASQSGSWSRLSR